MKARELSLWMLVGLATLGPLAAQAPEEQAEEESAYVETIEVNVVNVDVYVTDKKGNPVSGLTRDDFEILEDGRPVAVSNFYAVEEGRPVAQTPAPSPSEAPPAAAPPAGAPATEATAEVPDEQRLHLVVYVDNFNIRPFNRNRVFRRLREFLNENLTRQDRVMLVSYDRSLHVRHSFTTDPQLIASATFDLEEMTGHAVHADSERRDILRDIEEATSSGEVEWRIRQFAESAYNDLSFSIDAMREIVDSLGGLPGRKALLYVSDGLPMTPGEDLFYALNQKFQETSVLTRAREFDFSRRYRELTAQASSNRVVFYTIDAAGLRPPAASDVQMMTANTPALSSFVDSVYISNLQAPLIMMAEQTGGKAIYNTNDVGPALAEVATDFRTYYSLGYLPAHSGTGRLYKIEVRVKDRKDLVVRHRSSYRDKPLYARMSDSARSSLMYGFESNPLALELRFGQAVQADQGTFDVPILVGIPLDKIVLIPQSELHEGRVRLYFGAMDEDGDMSDVQEVNLPIRIPKDQLDDPTGKYYPFQTQLRIRPGGHRVTVGVWDEIGAVGSFVTKSVDIGAG